MSDFAAFSTFSLIATKLLFLCGVKEIKNASNQAGQQKMLALSVLGLVATGITSYSLYADVSPYMICVVAVASLMLAFYHHSEAHWIDWLIAGGMIWVEIELAHKITVLS